MKHQKHAKITKPLGGRFHRNEWAIIGAPCHIIKKLASAINEGLKSTYKIGFIDELHKASENDIPQYHSEFTNKLSHQEHHFMASSSILFYTSHFQECDAVLINGNHFKGASQIVIINQKKRESLSRKLDRLTDVQMVILDEGENEAHPFLKDYIDAENPIFRITETDKIIQYLSSKLIKNIPPVDGLILMGGKSTRMGEDKTKIDYHGMPQYLHAKKLLTEGSRKVYISGNDQDDYGDDKSLIRDTFTGLGPYGGILSAFRADPNRALFTLPTDTPLIDDSIIDFLIKNRDPGKVGTCFHNPETNFPEPLITIWEPRAYPIMLQYLAMGYSCPRKVLINEDINELKCPDPEKLKNANTPDERAEMKNILEKKTI